MNMLKTTLQTSFDDALERTKQTLIQQGFGIITTIDMQQTFQKKLNRPFRPYTILGACLPTFAFEALSMAPEIGLLMPCNVIVYQEEQDGIDASITIQAVDPITTLTAHANHPEFETLAADIQRRLQLALEHL